MVLQVCFQPSKANVYYHHSLECLVYFKSQRSFRLVNDATMSPPWMVSVAATGTTTTHRHRHRYRQRCRLPRGSQPPAPS